MRRPLQMAVALMAIAGMTDSGRAQAPQNGSFETGLDGWTVEGAVQVDVSAANDFAFFEENPQGAVSRIYQTFNLPHRPGTITFQYLMSWFPSSYIGPPHDARNGLPAPAAPWYAGLDEPARGAQAGFPFDAFSAFVVDPADPQQRLVPPEDPLDSDEFFFADNQGVIDYDPAYVSVSAPDPDGVRTVTADVSSLAGGQEVRVELGLTGGPDGFTTVLIVDNVRVTSLNFPPDVRIDEIRVDQPGSPPEQDPDEYFEIGAAAPYTLLDAVSYVVIGDGDLPGDSGVIEEVVTFDQVGPGSSARYVVGESALSIGIPDLVGDLNFEDGDNVTHLLVANFTGGVGEDLDIDDDGILDSEPWEFLLDDVAFVGIDEPGVEGDHIYSCIAVGPLGTGVPNHIFRCVPDGVWTVDSELPGDDEEDTVGGVNPACADSLCPWDLNNTDDVDAADLAILLGAWGPCPDPCAVANPLDPCPTDFDDNEVVDAIDLAQLLGHWGPCPVP